MSRHNVLAIAAAADAAAAGGSTASICRKRCRQVVEQVGHAKAGGRPRAHAARTARAGHDPQGAACTRLRTVVMLVLILALASS